MIPAATNYKYSFSGSDITTIAWFDVTAAVPLTTLTTCTFEINERKGNVRALGNRAVRGRTSAIRTIGGTMVFNIVNSHPLSELIALRGESPAQWIYTADQSRNIKSPGLQMPTTLPPFNLTLFGTTELQYTLSGEGAKYPHVATSLFGIEFLSEQLVFSVNNILTEVVYQFEALDCQTMYVSEFDIEVDNSLELFRKATQALEDLAVAGLSNSVFASSTPSVPDRQVMQNLSAGKLVPKPTIGTRSLIGQP